MNEMAYLKYGRCGVAKGGDGFVVGVDGGGTKTIAVLADLTGSVKAVAKGGPGNYQSVGSAGAKAQVSSLLAKIFELVPEAAANYVYGGFAMAGADRVADFYAVRDLIAQAFPFEVCGFALSNDTLAALWSVTDGVGVALVAGTGSNTIGVNAAGKVSKVGGLGPISGDTGGGEDLVFKALRDCIKAVDGRGEPTMMDAMFREIFQIDEIIDAIKFWYADDYCPPDLSKLSRVVFEAAGKGDKVALKILTDAGEELGGNALVALKRLDYTPEDEPAFAIGGSIMQKAEPPIVREAAVRRVLSVYPKARVMVARSEPVAGAVFMAMAEAMGGSVPPAVRAKLEAELNEKIGGAVLID